MENTGGYIVVFRMKYDHSTLPAAAAELKKIILEIQRQSSVIEADLPGERPYLNTQIRILRQTIFGAKSEKRTLDKSPQFPLFDMPEMLLEAEAAEPDNLEERVVPEQRRNKKGRTKLPEDLPRVAGVPDLASKGDCPLTNTNTGETGGNAHPARYITSWSQFT
jgi:hypothetical protein